MTFADIQKANSLIKTMPVKGKEYGLVQERVNAFRSLFPEGMILTEMLSNEDGMCVFKATVYDDAGKVLATGHAYEREGSTLVNSTSFIENCETSAVGRCLGLLGLTGGDGAIASAEEMRTAVANQDKPARTTKKAPAPQAQTYTPEPDEQLPWETGENTEAAGPVCTRCGNTIEARKTRRGDMWPADSIAAYTERKFGKKLCVDCMKQVENEAPRE